MSLILEVIIDSCWFSRIAGSKYLDPEFDLFNNWVVLNQIRVGLAGHNILT